MIPRRSAAAPALRPATGSATLPTLPAPTTRNVAELERLAASYAATHADGTGVSSERLAVAAFDTLTRHAHLIAAPVGSGRWSTRPPASGVGEARARLKSPAPF